MVRKFQTRLALWISLVIVLTVAGMTGLILLFAGNNLLQQHREKAMMLHQLLQKNIENVASVPSGGRDRFPRPAPPEVRPATTNIDLAPLPPPPGRGLTNEFSHRIHRFGTGRGGRLEVVLPGSRSMPRRSDLLVQGIADCFVVDTDIQRILVVQSDGRIVATAALEGTVADPPDSTLAEECQEYLTQSEAPFRFNVSARYVGVMTPLRDPDIEDRRALYVQYRRATAMELLGHRLAYILSLGAGMILLGIILSFTLSRRLSHPVHALADSVREFGNGNFGHRIDLKTDDEFQALGQAFNQMACSIQAHTRKLEFETKRRESLESELRIAAELQRSLLPVQPPRIPGLQLAGWSKPAAEVGGDFFDYLEVGDGQLGVMIGDATGKGLPAALLSTECWSVLKAFSQEAQSPAELLFKTNNALCRRLGDSGHFVTLFLMFLDPASSQLRYAMAGHNPPFLLRTSGARSQRFTSRVGLPLGLVPDGRFEDVTVDLRAEDIILLYSDGLTDASGANSRRFGENHLQELLHHSAHQDVSDLIAEIRQQLDQHVGPLEMNDDVTVVAVRFAPQQSLDESASSRPESPQVVHG